MDVFIQLLIAEADDAKAAASKPSSAARVVEPGIVIQMLRAFELDDQLERNHVRADCGLSAKLAAANLLGAENMLEAFLGAGGLVAERAGKVALVLVAVHLVGLPPP